MNPVSRRQVARFVADQLVKGEKVERVAELLAAYLVSDRKKRQAELIIRDIEMELMANHSYLSSSVSSARKLTDETRKSLIDMLERETGAKTVELVEDIDESLIGGMVVRTPEAELDVSLKNKLTRLKAI